jgi:hypothetical protein
MGQAGRPPDWTLSAMKDVKWLVVGNLSCRGLGFNPRFV